MALDPALRARIQGIVTSNDVVLFMKGNPAQPRCGFSAKVAGILDGLVEGYHTVDVLSDPDIREGIKVYSDWPTIPQLYIKGELMGGSDIVAQMAASGELHTALGVTLEEVEVPEITVTTDAATRLQEATRGGQGHLRFTIHPGYRYELAMGPEMYGDVVVESGGISLRMDRNTAKRAPGTVIAFERQGLQSGFVITNPAEPKPVQQLAVTELKAWLDAGKDLRLFDVRTPRERATAAIEGSTLLDAAGAAELEGLSKDTVLVFQCHHGTRSQQAADYYREQGFTQVYNLAGGIDAWSTQVDSSVPRY